MKTLFPGPQGNLLFVAAFNNIEYPTPNFPACRQAGNDDRKPAQAVSAVSDSHIFDGSTSRLLLKG
jgi:hypothetical protein